MQQKLKLNFLEFYQSIEHLKAINNISINVNNLHNQNLHNQKDSNSQNENKLNNQIHKSINPLEQIPVQGIQKLSKILNQHNRPELTIFQDDCIKFHYDLLFKYLKNCKLRILQLKYKNQFMLIQLSFANFSQLKQLYLVQMGIKSLEPISWIDMPKLQKLGILLNDLVSIKPLVKFYNTTGDYHLALQGNKILNPQNYTKHFPRILFKKNIYYSQYDQTKNMSLILQSQRLFWNQYAQSSHQQNNISIQDMRSIIKIQGVISNKLCIMHPFKYQDFFAQEQVAHFNQNLEEYIKKKRELARRLSRIPQRQVMKHLKDKRFRTLKMKQEGKQIRFR